MSKFVRAALLSALLAAAAWGQATAGLGGISGTVRDASGSPVPAAKVVVSNTSLGLTRELATTDAGIFSAPALVPSGGYKVSINKAGFAAYEANEISVQVGETVNLSVALTVGAVTQTVDVTATAAIVDDTKTESSSVVDNRMIKDLPINGRRVDQFVTLTPAVTKDADFGLVTFRGMAGGNNFLIDGNDTTNQYYNENAGRTRLGAQISQDAVQEFQVLTSAYSAEFGRAERRRRQHHHQERDQRYPRHFFLVFPQSHAGCDRSLLDRERIAFDPPEVRHQTGGTIGGPIMKNKLFAFFNTEIQRRTFPMVDNVINSSVNATTQTWIGCAAPATPAQCTAINSVLPRMFGLVPRNGNQSLYFLKLDYRPNERNSFSASMNYLKWLSVNGIQTGIVSTSGAAVGTNGDDSVRDRIGKLSWTYVPTGEHRQRSALRLVQGPPGR